MTRGPAPATKAAAWPHKRRSAVLAVAATSLFWLSLYLYVPVLPVQASRLGAGVGAVGLVLAAYGFVQFLLRIPTGLWTDRLGRRQPFLVAALAAAAIGAAGMGWAGSPGSLGLFRAVTGLAACGWVAITILLAEVYPAASIGGALALAGFLSRGGQLVGQFGGGAIAQAAGLRAPFLVAAAVGAIGVLVAAGVKEPPRPAVAGPSLRERLAVGTDRQVLATSGLSILAHWVSFVTVFGFLPLVAAERFGAGGLALGVLSVSSGAPGALAALVAGRLGDRWSWQGTAVVGFVVAGVGTALVPLAGSLLALNLAGAAIGIGLGLNGPALMTLAVEGFDRERRGTAMGFFQSIYAIGMFAGPAVAGAAGAQWGEGVLFYATAAIGLGAGALTPLLVRTRGRGGGVSRG